MTAWRVLGWLILAALALPIMGLVFFAALYGTIAVMP